MGNVGLETNASTGVAAHAAGLASRQHTKYRQLPSTTNGGYRPGDWGQRRSAAAVVVCLVYLNVQAIFLNRGIDLF
jgi:hypothetical protein